MTDKVSKPSLTVEEDVRKQFEMLMAGTSYEFFERDAQGAYRHMRIQGKWEAWRASRRRTLEEAIAKLRTKAADYLPDFDTYEAGANTALTNFADELESELKKEQP